MYANVCSSRFRGSEDYWVNRYRRGGDSGPGSYHDLAVFKADVINGFVKEHHIRTVIEYGCGDGNQLKLAAYPEYLGFDVSPAALSRCQDIFADDGSKSFKLMNDYNGETAELTLSLDVVYHLIEDEVFASYMRRLFDSASRFVMVYSTDTDRQEKVQLPHVKNRKFTSWVGEHMQGWTLRRHVLPPYPCRGESRKVSPAEFFIYERA
ncbi:MAG: class I SAM-dependent methyltransferase [Deltaproteobacteria bacterium]|nr:class I SAM-dependent methyltransferase [Deltaproteobacteria bacterium]